MREGWVYKKLGEVASFSRGLTYSKGDVAVDSSKKVLRSNNIDLATHSLNFDDVACLKEEFVIPVEKMLQQNDIFICMSNGSIQHLGKVAFIDKKMNYAFGGFMGAVHPKVNDIFPKYAFYFCLSSEYRRLLASVLNGININNLKWSDLSRFPIPVPPLSEQQRIVSELDLLSSIIEKKKAQLKEYDQLAQSIFYDMFGDPVTNEKGWEIIALKQVLKVIGGYAFKSDEFKENGIPVLRIGNINLGVFRPTNMVFWEKTEKLQRYLIFPNDLVMSLTGTVGKSDYGNVCILDNSYKEYYLNQRNAKLEIIGGIDKIYLSNILKFDAIKKRLTSISRGVRQANISNKDIENLKIPLPPLPLQQSFASKIEAIECQKSLIQQSITEAETLFNSRMDYWFS